MTTEQAAKLKEVKKNAVRAQVAAGGGVRWGERESLAVVADLVGALIGDDELALEGFDAIRQHVADVINPSAFAQALEKLPEGHPARIVRPKRGTGGRSAASDL